MAERDYLGGFTNTVIHHEADGSVVVEERQDAEPIIDRANSKRNSRFAGKSGDFQEEFDVPMVLVLAWQRECGAQMFSDEHMAYMNAKLRSPEYAYLSLAPKLRDPHILITGSR